MARAPSPGAAAATASAISAVSRSSIIVVFRIPRPDRLAHDLDQLGGVEGLRHDPHVRSGVLLELVGRAARQEDHGELGERGHRTEPSVDLVTVHPGHRRVEHEGVGGRGDDALERGVAPPHRLERDPDDAEVDLEEPVQDRVVVGEQDAGRGGIGHAPRISAPRAPEAPLLDFRDPSPRSSGDRAPASGAGGAGSNPAGGARGLRSTTQPLELESLPSDPVALFRRWYEDAERSGIPLPTAMALATAGADGRPSIRHVLLRGISDRGFVFYTNHGSRKGTELAENPRAAFSIYWRELDRQISVTGDVVPRERGGVRCLLRDPAARSAPRRVGLAAERGARLPRRADGAVRRRRRPRIRARRCRDPRSGAAT